MPDVDRVANNQLPFISISISFYLDLAPHLSLALALYLYLSLVILSYSDLIVSLASLSAKMASAF